MVSGDPTPEELAALVAVVASLGSAAAAPPRRTPEWQAHHRKVRATYAARPRRLALQRPAPLSRDALPAWCMLTP